MRNLLRRLNRDQDGTALTEFIITLPIFVLIFSFMFGLYSKTHELNRIRYRAATAMWTACMDVARAGTSVPMTHSTPLIASFDAMGIVSGSPSFAGDWMQNVLHLSPLPADSGREMMVGANMAGSFGASNPNNETTLDFSEAITEDGLLPPSPAGGFVAVFNLAILRSIPPRTRHAGIIGTRYGAVEGEASGTVKAGMWGGTEFFEAQYDVLVSPISYPGGVVDEYFIVGTSRLFAEDDDCMSTVLEISTSLSDC